MILLSHPTGNTFVRALLEGLEARGELHSFHTTLAFEESDVLVKLAPAGLGRELLRRRFAVPRSKIVCHPLRELVRLAEQKLGWEFFTAHETGWASVDAVYRHLDGQVARYLESAGGWDKESLTGVYCYEDSALQTFRVSRKLGLRCIYELPIAYWETSRRILDEEAARMPEWEPTLGGTRDSVEKLSMKTKEAELAELIICPSAFVRDSLPEAIRESKPCVVAEYGSPQVPAEYARRGERPGEKLRVLFAGQMSQRKGLGDLFQAMTLLDRRDVELVVMGSPVASMQFYRSQFPGFIHEATRPHQEVLELMQSCDVFVLPSLVEGRALVQQESMMCGLPVIITPNTGGADLVEEGRTGFIVPVRSPERIAEKIAWFADHRDYLEQMRPSARKKAEAVSWDRFRSKVLSAILSAS